MKSKCMTCKNCGLYVRQPITNEGQGGDKDNESLDDHVDDDDDEPKEPFIWPTTIDESKPRPMPPVSLEHRARIEKFRVDGIITNKIVYDVMMALDFGLFYHNVTDSWIEHNACIIERSIEVVKEGHHVLVCPFNTYFSVALALLVGPTGAVMCYGHLQNSVTLKKHNLDWLQTDYRLNFRNSEDALYYAVQLQVFQENGWQRMAPYDVILMSDQSLTDQLKSQLKEEGVVFRPDTADYLYRNHAGM